MPTIRFLASGRRASATAAAALLLDAAACGDIDVANPNNLSVGDLVASPSATSVGALATGLLRGTRTNVAESVRWLEIDLLDATLLREYAVWHDRAVFHFLTDPADRACYRQLAEASVRPGGQLVIGSFAEDGPQKCSGLPVQRHSALTIAATLGDAFELLETRHEIHRTPSGNAQRFVYCRFVHHGS